MAAEDSLGRQWKGLVLGKNKKTGARVHMPLEGRVVTESDTHITIDSPKHGVVNLPRGNVVRDDSPKPRTTRSSDERTEHRAKLLETIGNDWQRLPEGTNTSDVNHLIKHGHIESEVREEFDPQPSGGNTRLKSGSFGGAGVVKRRRRYVRKAQNGRM